jgi:hypothetical protein
MTNWGGGERKSAWPGDADEQPTAEGDAQAWPVLRPADGTQPCEGANPATGRACVIGYHKGYHRDVVGSRWLDDE